MTEYRFQYSPSYTGNGVITEFSKSKTGKSGPFSVTTFKRGSQGSVFTLAKAFLFLAPMTHKKLQKLCYYAKAWHLALYDENIIPEQFQAWVHGAVQPGLYQLYKDYGFELIPRLESQAGIPEGFLDFASEIYDAYGDLTGDQLEAINHKELPWIKARGACKPWEKCTEIIAEEDMKSFYRSMIDA